MVFVNDNIPSRELAKTTFCDDIEVIPIEINLRKSKWLILPIYRPHWVGENKFVGSLSSLIDFYSKYDNIITLGDFNMTQDNPNIVTFMKEHNFYNLIKDPTCFKSPEGKCIDLLLTNQKYSHKFSQTFETGFSDFHTMI